MQLRRTSASVLALAIALSVWPTAVHALIERLTPLATLIEDADEIFVARFDRVDAEKLSAVLAWEKDVKDKTELRRLPVKLTGDKEGHAPQFLKRIAPRLPVVLFVTRLDEKLLALGYTDGTWFQMIGTPGKDREPARWAFTHCEIYLRRTFRGTTKEMISVVEDAVSGKQKPPKPNPKEPPGFGPEVKKDEASSRHDCASERACQSSEPFAGVARPSRQGGRVAKRQEAAPCAPEWFCCTPLGLLRADTSLHGFHELATCSAVEPVWCGFSSLARPGRSIETAGPPTINTIRLLCGRIRSHSDRLGLNAYGLAEPACYSVLSYRMQPLVAVVTLPFLAPLAALLQLLFPGLLRDQWRRYRIAIAVLTTQSTLLAAHWIALRWFVKVRPRWLGDDVLWASVVAVACFGCFTAAIELWNHRNHRNPTGLRPVPVEFFALGGLLLAGLGWACFQWITGASLLDQMIVVTIASAVAIGHLALRARSAANPGNGAPRLSTEVVLLGGLTVVGAATGWHVNSEQENRAAGLSNSESSEWPMFRANAARSGCLAANDHGPLAPEILWVFDPKERKGRVRLHSSPAVVDGFVFIGGMHEVQTLTQGALYCINAVDGRIIEGDSIAAGERVWKFTDQGSLKPVFSSPSVAGGRLLFGEGYHQDQGCRFFCLDVRRGDRPLWTVTTRSHVESSPTLAGARAYVGAGDDGILCLKLSELDSGTDAEDARPPENSLLWKMRGVHVDGSCLVADGRLFVGSVLGDVYRELCALAIDATTGNEIWRIPAPMPIPASPACAGDRVYFGLGNGKMDFDDERPAGALWCLEAATGADCWKRDTGGSVLASPAVIEDHVVVCSRNGHCISLAQQNGEPAWDIDLGSPIVASPAVTTDRLYVVTVSGSVICLNAHDGAELWRLKLDAPDEDVYSSPALSEGKLYVAAGGKLYCIGAPRSDGG